MSNCEKTISLKMDILITIKSLICTKSTNNKGLKSYQTENG